jgi:hypothetical protein
MMSAAVSAASGLPAPERAPSKRKRPLTEAAAEIYGEVAMAKIPHIEKFALIRRELMRCATSHPMEFPTYSTFAPRAGMPIRGPWKNVLDAISRAETKQGLPDITFVLISQRTRYPSQIGFTRSKKPTPQQIAHARQEVQLLDQSFLFSRRGETQTPK